MVEAEEADEAEEEVDGLPAADAFDIGGPCGRGAPCEPRTLFAACVACVTMSRWYCCSRRLASEADRAC